MLFRNSVRDIDFELMPILVFIVSHTFHLLRIVRIIIDSRHRPDLVESLDQHPFMVHIGKSHRSVYSLHPLFFRPFFYGPEQSVHYFDIVNKVYESETCMLLVPGLIAPAIDHPRNASHNLPVFVRQKIDRVTHFERRILLLIQRHHLFFDQAGHVIRVAFI